MIDNNETARQSLKDIAETDKAARQEWTTDQLRAEFEVIGFQAPFVVVIRKADRVKGSLQFDHQPRIYYDFKPYNE